jgi:hypothetical protein
VRKHLGANLHGNYICSRTVGCSSCGGFRHPANGGDADVVAPGEFLKRSAFCVALAGLFPLRSAVRVRIRSRSTHRPIRQKCGPASRARLLVPVSSRRSPSVVIMKSQPGRSPPMRQVTSLGPWPSLPVPIAIAPLPIRPTTAHRDRRTAPRECRNARRRETPRGGPRLLGRIP